MIFAATPLHFLSAFDYADSHATYFQIAIFDISSPITRRRHFATPFRIIYFTPLADIAITSCLFSAIIFMLRQRMPLQPLMLILRIVFTLSPPAAIRHCLFATLHYFATPFRRQLSPYYFAAAIAAATLYYLFCRRCRCRWLAY